MLSNLTQCEKEKLCDYFVDAMDQNPDGYLAASARQWIENFSQSAISDGKLKPEYDLVLVLNCFWNIFYLYLKVFQQVSIVNDLDSSSDDALIARSRILELVCLTGIQRIGDSNLDALEMYLFD